MATERHNYLISLAFDPGNSIQGAEQTRQKINEILRGVGGEGAVGPAFDPKRFGDELRRSIQSALQTDVRNSPLFRSLSQANQELLAGLQGTDPSRYLSQQARLAIASTRVDEVERKGQIPYGEQGGFRDYEAHLKAELAAAAEYNNANKQLTNAKKRHAQEVLRNVTQEARAQDQHLDAILSDARALFQAMERRNRSLTKMDAAEAKRIDAIGRDAAAIFTAAAGRRASIEKAEAAEAKRIDAIGRDAAAIFTAAAGRRRSFERAEAAERRRVTATLSDARSIFQAMEGRNRSFRRREDADRREQAATGRAILAIERRAVAEQRAARAAMDRQAREHMAIQRRTDAERERQRNQREADEILARDPTYHPTDPNTRIGRAQEAYNQAELRHQAALMRLAEVRASETRTAQQAMAAQQRVRATSVALANAQERLAMEQMRASGPSGIGAQFMQGFRGVGERPYAEQIGQAMKFSVFYGTAYRLLFGLTQTLQATLNEGIEFQQAMTELSIATNRPKEELDNLAEVVGRAAVAAGQAPSAGLEIASRAQGLYGTTQAPLDDQARVAEISARVVSRLGFTTGTDAREIQTQLAAMTNAFQLGIEGTAYAADLDAFLTKRFGAAMGGTVESVAQSGSVGQSAGFSLEETTAIAALLQGRTGQTPAAVAGFMAQIFSRGGEGALATLSQRYGADPRSELSEQFRVLADAYRQGTAQDRSEISAAFGRGKVQNAVVALLDAFPEVEKAAADAQAEAAGASERAFNERLGNIGGQIQLTLGVMRDFASALGDTGMLEVLGAGVVVFREFLESVTALLRLWNEMPGALRATIAGLAGLTVAARMGALGGAAGAVGRAGGLGMFRAGGTPLVERGGRIAPLASGRGLGMLGSGLAAAAAPALPWVAAAGGLYALAELSSSSRELRDAQEAAARALSDGALGTGATPEQLAARAANLEDEARSARASTRGFWARMAGGRDDVRATADRLDEEAERLRRVADMRREADQAMSADSAFIQSFDADSLAQAMELITASGGTARERLDALSESLSGTAEAAARADAAFRPDRFALDAAGGVYEAIQQQDGPRVVRDEATGFSRAVSMVPVLGGWLGGAGVGRGETDITEQLIQQALSATDVQERLQASLAGIGNLSDLTPEAIRRIADSVVGDTASALGEDQGGSLDESGVSAARAAMISSVEQYLRREAQNVRDVLSQERRLTSQELTAVITQVSSDTQALISAMPESNHASRARAARAALRQMLNYINRPGADPTPEVLSQVAAARLLVAETTIAQIDATRIAAQQNAESMGEVRRIGRATLRQAIRVAVNQGAADSLVGIINQAGAGAIAIARNMINEALRVARAAAQMQAEWDALQRERAAIGALRIPDYDGPSAPKGNPGEEALRKLQESLKNVTFDPENSWVNGRDVPGLTERFAPPKGSSAAAGAQESAAARAAARAAAEAARRGSSIEAARAEIQQAQAAMADAERGSVAYYNALGQFYQAQQGLRDAILEYRELRNMLNIDITDPVAQARVALRAARRRLEANRRAGMSSEVLDADRLAVREAEGAREAAAFEARLSRIQTNEELGRISHRRYLRYLENERRRLSQIADRTHQQQEQLNQIDRLMQEAASSMEGMWNFGDIRLPRPYEVRRYMEDQFQARGYYRPGPQVVPQQNVTFYVDGADVGKVRQIIEDVVGASGRTMSTAVRRR